MSKRDDILKALDDATRQARIAKELLDERLVIKEALELALHKEEEALKYDAYCNRAQEEQYAAGFEAAAKAADDPNHPTTDIF